MKIIKHYKNDAKFSKPASSLLRQKPLTWQHAKSSLEDTDAPYHIKAILNSSGYRQANQNVDYLNLDETRGVMDV